jgi:hypothetical protein
LSEGSFWQHRLSFLAETGRCRRHGLLHWGPAIWLGLRVSAITNIALLMGSK